MNYNKRFAAFIAAAMLTAGSLSTTAAETPYCHTIGNVTVSFDEGTMIPTTDRNSPHRRSSNSVEFL